MSMQDHWPLGDTYLYVRRYISQQKAAQTEEVGSAQ